MLPSNIEALQSQFQIGTLQERRAAMIAMSRIRDAQVVPVLVEALQDDDNLIRAFAAAGVGYNAAQSAHTSLLALLDDPDTGVRGNAAWALGELADEQLIPDLLVLLDDESPEVRGKTCWTLGNIAELTNNTTMVDALIVLLDDFAEIPSSSAHLFVSQYAAEALLQINTDEAKAAVERWKPIVREKLEPRRILDLIRALQHSDQPTREETIRQLLAIGPEALDACVEALETHENARVRQGVAHVLGELGDKRAVKPLLNALSDPDPGVWSHATAALGKIPAAEKNLRKALLKKEKNLRFSAALALWRIKREEKAFKVLLEAIQDEDVIIRGSAITSLWLQPDERAVATLQIQLQHEEEALARYILQALQIIGTPAANATINHWLSEHS